MKLNRRHFALAIALLIPLAFAGSHSAQRLGRDDDPARRKIVDDYYEAFLLAKDNYAGQIEYEKLIKSSILGMLHTLDPHSSYLDPKEWEAFQNEQRSRYSGIGSTIAQRNGKVYIMSPFDGTPAHRAGIRYGDQIIEINGESTEGWNSVQVSNKLLGPAGTAVTVKVARLGVSQPLEFRLIRENVSLPSITTYFMVNKTTGYIALSRGFNTTTADEMYRAMRSLKEQGMTSLILDLRGNRGGLVDQAWKVANIFLYKGQKILSMRGRPNVFQARDLIAYNNSPDESPLVVLINRGTASAAEIVAGALQDHDRARIVGENSFGKGLVQNVFPLSDGSGLTLTTGKYYTPSGRLIQRDYSHRSFYDYYLQRGDKEAVQRTDERHTDSGRTVYGGGGIAPDVEVKFPAIEIERQRVWLDAVFEFTRALVAGQIPGFPEFKIDHPADHNHRLEPDEYRISDKVLAAFKTFIRDHKGLKVNEARVDKDADFLKRWIRYEVVTAAYGAETAAQVLLEGDVQMQRAIAELPQAKALADTARRAWAAARSGLKRD
jgi:carboxyl-terminal processing protease